MRDAIVKWAGIERMGTVAIIGSGIGGLVAGNLLAKKGHKVTIFESHIKTPVKNLYIGSCWDTQIGGVPSALNAAHKCVKKIK